MPGDGSEVDALVMGVLVLLCKGRWEAERMALPRAVGGPRRAAATELAVSAPAPRVGAQNRLGHLCICRLILWRNLTSCTEVCHGEVMTRREPLVRRRYVDFLRIAGSICRL